MKNILTDDLEDVAVGQLHLGHEGGGVSSIVLAPVTGEYSRGELG